MRGLIKHILKEETNNFELVKNLIYTMFDNVRVVEYVAERNEVMIYYTNRDNRQMLIPTEICDMITKYTGLDVVPWYDYSLRTFDDDPDNEPDFYIDTEEYEESINEGIEQHPREEEFNRYKDDIDRIVYSVVSKEEICGYGTEFFLNGGEDALRIVLYYNKGHYPGYEEHMEYAKDIKGMVENYLPIVEMAFVSYDSTKCKGRVTENVDDIEKNLKVIKTILSQVSWDGLCDIWVEYNPIDKDYEIRSKSTIRPYDHDEIIKDLDYIDNALRSMGLSVYIYTPWYVDSCEDEVKFLNESKEKTTKELITTVLNTIVLPEYEHVICGFEVKQPHERFDTLGNTSFQFMSVTIIFIGGIGTKLWPQTQGVQRMYDDVTDEVWDVIYNYTNEAVDVYYKTVKDCGKENIYLRESKENYSPAGKEIIPNKIVIHKSNPKVRDKISNEGLKVRAGECYKIYAGYGEKCVPAIFATNSTNKRASFDSTYDDDVWEINTEMIPDVKWYKDRHYESRSKHIVTFENIPVDAITLKHEGTGKDWGLMESKEKSTKELITTVLNTLVLPQYKHVICGFELKNVDDESLDNVINYPGVTVTFIGGKGTNLYPQTSGVQKMYDDVLDEIWDTVWDYTGVSLELYSKYVKDCGKENIYLREQKEEPKYLSLIKELVEPFKDEEGVCDINVSYDDEDDMYSVYIVIGTEEMNEKFFYVPAMNNHISKLRMNVKNTIKQYIPIDNLYVGSYGKPNCEWDPISK